MLGKFWVVLFVALAGAQVGRGLPLRSAPPSYPHESSASNSWITELPFILPAIGLLITAGGLVFGCAWCFKHKDCKPEEGAENQLFTASTAVVNIRNPPDSGFYEASNNNISEDNNNGPISLRDIQNIANNNATAYISADNEERNTASRESVVEFEPLPHALPRDIGVTDPLARCADWFVGDDLPRNRLQYLREIGRGWFGRVVEGEIEDHGSTSTVAVKILDQNASREDKARFLEENRLYKDVRHENVLRYFAKYLGEDPWLVMFEFCYMDLQQYLETNRTKMAILNENAVPIKLICDVTSALTYLHSRGHLYGNVTCSNVLVRDTEGSVSAVLGSYSPMRPAHEAPECRRNQQYTSSSEVWSLGTFIWEVTAWGASPVHHPPPVTDLPFPYSNHLYQVMQLCWDPVPQQRPTSAEVDALVHHLLSTRNGEHADGDFEDRWMTLKPNSIPKVDEHIAIIHAPSTSHFSTDTLSIDDTVVSRSSSMLSDQLSNQVKSESLTNLHGSLEDVRNIYLTHNEHPTIECHQGNIAFDDKEDRSDSSVDPWLKDIIAGSQDDVSYYKDVSDVIKNLDNILNSEKTSSSESSHQASPSRDNLSLDCKKEAPVQSSLVKSPGICNFQNILESGVNEEELPEDEERDRDTIGSLSHSFERHSDTTSQHTLENLTPDTPVKDDFSSQFCPNKSTPITEDIANETVCHETVVKNDEGIIPKEEKRSVNKLPNLRELTVTSITSVSEEQLNIRNIPSDSLELRTEVETKSVDKSNKYNSEIFVQKEEASNEIDYKTKIGEELRENVVEIASNLVENEVIKPAIESVYKMQEHHSKEETHLDPLPSEISGIKKCHSSHLGEAGCPSVIEGPKHVQDEIRITTLFGGLPTTHVQRNNQEHRHIIPFKQVLRLESNESSSLFENVLVKPKVKSLNDSKPFESVLEKTNVIVKQKSVSEMESNDIKQTSETNSYKYEPGFEDITSSLSETPEPVQSSDDMTQVTSQKLETTASEVTLLATEVSDNLQTSTEPDTYPIDDKIHEEEERRNEQVKEEEILKQLKEERLNVNASEFVQGNDSTVYKDLINSTKAIDNFKTLLDNTVNSMWLNDESTIYLDLPRCKHNTEEFLHNEKIGSDEQFGSGNEKVRLNDNKVGSDNDVVGSSAKEKLIFCTSTPKEESKQDLSETVPNQEQIIIRESSSPFESPTKSLKTDTYDENSSVFGPFETSMEYKCLKTDTPKEEYLAFSSNFNEINLATPSPLRDVNFLNEVPDVSEFPFDDFTSEKTEINEPKSENSDSENYKSENSEAGTTKHVSPSTPPNSPGMFLASTSQQKYLVDIDLEHNIPSSSHNLPSTSYNIPSFGYNIPSSSHISPQESDPSSWLDINEIEMQITSKLAMAENENNLNIEYSGPLTVEGIVSEDDVVLRDNDAIPEAVLAGNGGSVEDLREFSLDEACVKALRDELELKLPLAQVASIEPACQDDVEEGDPESDPSWSTLPPPPEVVVCYLGGALSPIAEETRHQLSAYDNDAWNTSNRTDSSESYLEPCNNSTDEITELPTATQPTDTTAPGTGTGSGSPTHNHSTYTVHSANNTYTVQRDVPSSKEITMSPDSLNSPHRKPKKSQTQNDPLSPIKDETYDKNDDNECDHISQESPFLLSPTTDTSVQENGNTPTENATAISTLSKTDTKQQEDGLSKATSIDSWCSNDTLYNVEENFDDLAIEHVGNILEDADKKEDRSEGTDTLNNGDKSSHCSTYIIHDSDSECDTFSRDSITEKDNYTYTKVKTETVTPSVVTTNNKSETNDTTKDTQIVDVAYGTLPSYSSCATEVVATLNDPWMLPQSEMMRRSPLNDIDITPTQNICYETQEIEDIPNIIQPSAKMMNSVQTSCLNDDSVNDQNKSENSDQGETNAFRCDYNKNMTPSVTSTPLAELVQNDDAEAIPMVLPLPGIVVEFDSPQTLVSPTNFNAFVQSAEIRPQDVSNYSHELTTILTGTDTGLLLAGESSMLSKSHNTIPMSELTTNYSDFQNSALHKPQEINSDSSSQFETGISSGDFTHFETSVRCRPQDLSSLIDASSMFLNSERKSSSIALTSHSRTQENFTLSVSPPNISNFVESQSQPLVFNNESFAIGIDVDEETDQPHSIIITDVLKDLFIPNSSITNEVITASPKSPNNENNISGEFNKTYDSHEVIINETYNSHERSPPVKNEEISEDTNKVETNDETHFNGSTLPTVETSNKTSPSVETINKTSPSVETTNIISATIETGNKTSSTIETGNMTSPLGESSSKTLPTVETSNKTLPSVETGNNIEVVYLNSSLVNSKDNHDAKYHNGKALEEIKCNGAQNYATVNFINETFEEILDSEDDNEEQAQENKQKDVNTKENQSAKNGNDPKTSETILPETTINNENQLNGTHEVNGELEETKMAAVTEDFLQNEKDFSRIGSYLPLLSDIRFSGPTSEIMSTSFTQDSPTEEEPPESEQDNKQDTAADSAKEWDSDTDSQSSHSSSGEFIWKGGDGREMALVPTNHFDHQRSSGHGDSRASEGDKPGGAGADGGSAHASGDSGSGSGSEGDEVEFVPSSWDCRAEPAKSSLRTLQQITADSKKRVVFKRQKYHCVYEYPREAVEVDTHSPAYLPDFSTYCEWDPSSAEDVEMGYGQLLGAPCPLDMYPLRGGYGADYVDDFFISSSARPFEALGVMSTSSQFFPGMHAKALHRDLQIDDNMSVPIAPPSPLPLPTHVTAVRTPSLDFTTPDSGVEDITPGSTITDEDFRSKKLDEVAWKPSESTSSSESVSPSSPGGEALGGLRHTRDKLKLDLPPSPLIPSPRHNRVFNFILDKPRRRHEEPITPLVMTDETPVITSSLPLDDDESTGISSEPTFSTFGKDNTNNDEAGSEIVLDEAENRNESDVPVCDEKKDESPVKETVKGEGTVLDSGDEDSGIESSSKASLERKTNFSS